MTLYLYISLCVCSFFLAKSHVGETHVRDYFYCLVEGHLSSGYKGMENFQKLSIGAVLRCSQQKLAI